MMEKYRAGSSKAEDMRSTQSGPACGCSGCGRRLGPAGPKPNDYCPGQVTQPMKSGLAPHRRLELPLASCFEGLLKAAMCPPIPVVILQPLPKDSSRATGVI